MQIPVEEVAGHRPTLGIEPPADPDLEFVYVGDPMCSWCWGFAPALEQLQERYTIPLRTVVGGLRAGADTNPMDAETLQSMGRYWENVAERTSQPFTKAALQRDGWTYDTEPSRRAVVAMRELAAQETLRWMARLHRAFYVEGVDVTDLSVFPGLLDGFAVDPERYTQVLTDTATLEPALTEWIEQEYSTQSRGLVCDPPDRHVLNPHGGVDHARDRGRPHRGRTEHWRSTTQRSLDRASPRLRGPAWPPPGSNSAPLRRQPQ